MHSNSRSPHIWQYIGVALCTASILIILAASVPFFAPGISNPQPIGPYLNNVFPDATPGSGAAEGNWIVADAYPNLRFPDPMSIIQIPDLSGFYITGKPGYIWKIGNDSTTNSKTLILDISAVVHTDGDAGLINMILHPEFGVGSSPNRGYIYVIYRYHPQGDAIGGCGADAYTRLSRFTKPDGLENFDVNSELVLIQQFDTHCWHTGGGMFFDPEGYLYFTFGDAGGANDQYNTSQQIDQSLFGGLHRIDVDKVASRSHPIRRQPIDPPHGLAENSYTQGYYIPNDNPWVDPDSNVLEEFFALGLRSPHRASYDITEDRIYVADVGQAAREEISIVVKGDNLQWPFREGSISGPKAEPPVLIGNSKDPVYDYSHAQGEAIIGGFVYRGIRFNGALDGKYLFGDHGTRNIWTFNPNTHEISFLANVPFGGVGAKNGISSFGTDAAGNIYVLKLFGTDQDGGIIYKLLPGVDVPDPPALLSQTGAFTDLVNLVPAPGLIPYDVNAPLWSDGAAKKRWVAIPNDGTHNTPAEQITFSDTSFWQFPPGTVFVKHFELATDHNNPAIKTKIETRFIVVKPDSTVYGVTYKWNQAGTDATLLTMGDTTSYTITLDDQSTVEQLWTFPSRTNCRTCHNSNSGQILGLQTWQLNGDYTYPSMITDNQLNTWLSLGLFSNPFNTNEISTFLQAASVTDLSFDLETRVRSYLDANCAFCHRPNGVNGIFDARFSTPLQNQKILQQEGISNNTPVGSLIVKPFDPNHSEIWLRDNSLGNTSMPPLGKSIIDTAYISVLTDWINGLVDSSCYITYVSDLPFATAPINGWGPVELDQSNGSTSANDGTTMMINGVSFSKGLGVHAYSEVLYDLNGLYTSFETSMGVDDETCNDGSVVFNIYLDDILTYQSPLLTQADNALFVEIDVTGKNQLKLIVTDGNGSVTCDHADWAEARLIRTCDDGDPCTDQDAFGPNCVCAGKLVDYNNDGVCDSLNFNLAITAYLEGPFLNPSGGEPLLMRDDLRTDALIPTTSPYADGKTCDPSVFSVSGPDAIVDWVWVELRDENDNTTVLEGISGLLQRDGNIVATDGTSDLTFKIGEGNYYLALNHRNHLGVMSSTAHLMGFTATTSFDVSQVSFVTYGTNATKLMSGKNALWTGDADGDYLVDAADRSETWNHRNSQSYHLSDCNLDGVTDASDRSITWNNRNLIAQLPE